MVDEGKITPQEAVLRIDAKSLDQVLHPTFDTEALKAGEVIGEALPASPGAAAGKIVFTAEDAKRLVKENKKERVILVRLETSPEDIEGMHAAQGILTVRGGMTSHAAVVARGMGTCCVSGCGAIAIDEEAKEFTLGGYTFHEGDFISLDGTTGKIYKGDIQTVEATVSGNFGRIMEWADEFRTLGVRTNADTPADTKKAVELGAEGIGLCRTEHMFFEQDRIPKIRKMILSKTVEGRVAALDELLVFQKADFKAMYEALEGRPMTVRYLDPPLHEFLPTEEEDIKALAEDMHMTVEEIKETCAALHEFNPMMGHRGCRLAVTYPEIARMQTRAVMEAAIQRQKHCPNRRRIGNLAPHGRKTHRSCLEKTPARTVRLPSCRLVILVVTSLKIKKEARFQASFLQNKYKYPNIFCLNYNLRDFRHLCYILRDLHRLIFLLSV